MIDTSKNPSLSELIKHGRCSIKYIRAGFICYNLLYEEVLNWKVNEFDLEELITNTYKYEFFVPIDDIGQGTLKSTEKAITLMRWIRKAYNSNELILISNSI